MICSDQDTMSLLSRTTSGISESRNSHLNQGKSILDTSFSGTAITDQKTGVPAIASSAGKPRVGVVTVTYDSERFFTEYMDALQAQTLPPDLVVLVDSGSTKPEFLNLLANYNVSTVVLQEENVGFCVGCNMGWRKMREFEYVLFLNPDAFLASDFLEKAVAYMESDPGAGMITGSLLRYDIENHKAFDVVDTTGVIRNRYGLYAERDHAMPASVLNKYTAPNEIPWLCGAVAMGRREAMDTVVEHDNQLFDESFFMYKDDTDLSWRIRRAGWRIMHVPTLLGYHCRGWQDRSTFPRKARLLTSRNEIKMCIKNRSPFVVLSLLKYSLVALFNL